MQAAEPPRFLRQPARRFCGKTAAGALALFQVGKSAFLGFCSELAAPRAAARQLAAARCARTGGAIAPATGQPTAA